MTLNHLNLTVNDVQATKAFLMKYFDLRPMEGVEGNKGFDILRDDNGIILTIMKGSREGVKYPPTFHIGFAVPSQDTVNEINARLKEDGIDVPDPAHMHGSWTFYFEPPGGGFTIEVLS